MYHSCIGHAFYTKTDCSFKQGINIVEKTGNKDWITWVRLMQTDGVGTETARKLLSAFGLPQNIFAASFFQLRAVVSERIAELLLSPITDYIATLLEKTEEWIEQPGNSILTLADADYPKMLLEIPDPPVLLYVKGRRELLSEPAIAVVGSRNATQQGCIDARRFSLALSETGFTIVSGMALGIDSSAHEGGLKGGSSTIAVTGTGADIVYPARSHSLAHSIAENGCIVTEYPLGTAALATNFPRRNRIISGLSRGVLVVEAAAKSGSLITARTAAEQGRDVFAIPGSIHSPLSRGCHYLIRQGAKLVESAQDILEDLAYTPKDLKAVIEKSDIPEVDLVTQEILFAIGYDPIDIDTLMQRCNMDTAVLNAELLQMELKGLVERLPDGRYQCLNK